MDNVGKNHLNSMRPVIIWLYSGIILILLMVAVGGAVRLTDSGLSIVEWKPVSGIIPPMNNAEWQEAFDNYKKIPEYKIENYQIDLNQFKKIFLWEYFHRLIARIIGLVFIIPFVFFWIRGYFRKDKLLFKILLIFILALFQAWLGWYMVQSGFTKLTDVSHYRLAIHLFYATLLASYVLWVVLDIQFKNDNTFFISGLSKFTLISLLILAVQLFYGAFTAGLNAGYYFNDYPKMGGEWIPTLGINAIKEQGIQSVISDPVVVYFIHRWWAIVLFVWLLFYSFRFLRKTDKNLLKNLFKTIIILISFQLILGIITVLSSVNIFSAIIHQVNGIAIFLVLVSILYFSLKPKRGL
ncbi:MAG: COX15/CtaA family protein [Saprospiraceae bacterium]